MQFLLADTTVGYEFMAADGVLGLAPTQTGDTDSMIYVKALKDAGIYNTAMFSIMLKDKDPSTIVFGGYDKKYAPTTDSVLGWNDKSADNSWDFKSDQFYFGGASFTMQDTNTALTLSMV